MCLVQGPKDLCLTKRLMPQTLVLCEQETLERIVVIGVGFKKNSLAAVFP